MTESPLSSMPFSEASAFWLEQHKRYIKPNTLRNYQGRTLKASSRKPRRRDRQRHPNRARACVPGRTVEEGWFLPAQLRGKRPANDPERSAVLGESIADLYKPLQVPKRCAGHSISVDEERILREVAFGRPKWRLAAHCMTSC